ncbi:hypothetical protein [Nonlabens sp. Asnod3-H03]|uniref:Uncharacterized protein n=1 Tax=Nonlabens ulvanivorans TaxID=906888 RepID=A0A081DA65_NONUL|nr:hypothetical protein [Nonlabens ulvanivorans]GAK75811.1 hypothetical protein JCM19296_1403 [Nonlabens ulvanivorans]
MKLLGIGSRINHDSYGFGVVTNVTAKHYWVTFQKGGLETLDLDEEFEVIEACEDDVDTVSFYDVEKSLREILERFSDVTQIVPLADKYKNGTMVLKPADSNLSVKEIPINTFWHKIVMLRDRLRVMEQKINSSDLDDQAKVDLQQYITRIYGSLTTFNVLFASKEQQFKGSGK